MTSRTRNLRRTSRPKCFKCDDDDDNDHNCDWNNYLIKPTGQALS